MIEARRAFAAMAAAARPFETFDALHVAGRCPRCAAPAAASARLDGFAHLRDAPWRSARDLGAWLDATLADAPPLACEGDPPDDPRCACGEARGARAPEAAWLLHPMAGTGASLLVERRLAEPASWTLFRVVDDAPVARVADALDDEALARAFGRDLTLAHTWGVRVGLARAGAAVWERVEPGCWIGAAPDRASLLAPIEALAAREPGCVVVALGAPGGVAAPRSWARWLGERAADLRQGACFAAFAIDRARFAECAALAWHRATGGEATVGDEALMLRRGDATWSVRLDEACRAAGEMALTLSEGVRLTLDEVTRRLDALDGALRAAVAARPHLRFEREGDALVPLRSDGVRVALSLRALAFETPAGGDGFERALRFACDPLPPWSDPSRVCACGAPAFFSARLVPVGLVDALVAASGGAAPAVLALLPEEGPAAASVVAVGCDLHGRVAWEPELAAMGYDLPSIAQRLRHDARAAVTPVRAALYDDDEGRRALLVSGPWASSAMLDDPHLSALHAACGAPLDLRAARVVTVSTDALMVYDPAMPAAFADAVLAIAARQAPDAAPMLVARDARLDALPLGAYALVGEAPARPARLTAASQNVVARDDAPPSSSPDSIGRHPPSEHSPSQQER